MEGASGKDALFSILGHRTYLTKEVVHVLPTYDVFTGTDEYLAYVPYSLLSYHYTITYPTRDQTSPT